MICPDKHLSVSARPIAASSCHKYLVEIDRNCPSNVVNRIALVDLILPQHATCKRIVCANQRVESGDGCDGCVPTLADDHNNKRTGGETLGEIISALVDCVMPKQITRP